MSFYRVLLVLCLLGLSHLQAQSDVEFVGISEDRNVDAWKSAIRNDRIGSWQHGLDNQQNSNVAKLYGVAVYPTKVLIDPNGMIVGRYEGNDNTELVNKIESLIKKI